MKEDRRQDMQYMRQLLDDLRFTSPLEKRTVGESHMHGQEELHHSEQSVTTFSPAPMTPNTPHKRIIDENLAHPVGRLLRDERYFSNSRRSTFDNEVDGTQMKLKPYQGDQWAEEMHVKAIKDVQKGSLASCLGIADNIKNSEIKVCSEAVQSNVFESPSRKEEELEKFKADLLSNIRSEISQQFQILFTQMSAQMAQSTAPQISARSLQMGAIPPLQMGATSSLQMGATSSLNTGSTSHQIGANPSLQVRETRGNPASRSGQNASESGSEESETGEETESPSESAQTASRPPTKMGRSSSIETTEYLSCTPATCSPRGSTVYYTTTTTTNTTRANQMQDNELPPPIPPKPRKHRS